ncbi:MAG: hypothetical protein RI907_154 [Pseudomonadota bacterium]
MLFVKGGSHGWRFDYSFEGRRKTLSLGTYPATGLALARKQAAEARKLVREGVDPSAARQEKKAEITKQRAITEMLEAGVALPESFEAVAREWFASSG